MFRGRLTRAVSANPILMDQAVRCAPHPLVALLAQVCPEGERKLT